MSPLADGGGGSGGDNTFQNAEHPHQGQLVDWDTLQIVGRTAFRCCLIGRLRS